MSLRFLRRAATLIGLAALAACSSSLTPYEGSAPDPLPAHYRKLVLDWARGFFAEPHALRAAAIAKPIRMRNRNGAAMWLVCVEADARARGGGYMGPRRYALQLIGGHLQTPASSGGAIRDGDCEALALQWSAFPELERL